MILLLLLALLLTGCAKHGLLDAVREKRDGITIHVHCDCEEKTKAPAK